MWSFRPSALVLADYAHASVQQLFQLYQEDNACAEGATAQSSNALLPPRIAPSAKGFRTCQWNIHCCNDSSKTADEMVKKLAATQADVLVLNEVGDPPGSMTQVLQRGLARAGYHTITIADCYYPTAIATKLPVMDRSKFTLDHERAAVSMLVAVDDTTLIRIYGTHLEAFETASSGNSHGEMRHREMQKLLSTVKKEEEQQEKEEKQETAASVVAATMVMGDFNQQRSVDYTATEWERIVENKARRKSPVNDGVDTLLQQAGFVCVWDAARSSNQHPEHVGVVNGGGGGGGVKTNWLPTDPPPSTHWTGTIVDYTYYKSHPEADVSVQLAAVHVSPCGLSDHRMIVCDWLIVDNNNMLN